MAAVVDEVVRILGLRDISARTLNSCDFGLDVEEGIGRCGSPRHLHRQWDEQGSKSAESGNDPSSTQRHPVIADESEASDPEQNHHRQEVRRSCHRAPLTVERQRRGEGDDETEQERRPVESDISQQVIKGEERL
jgi:hypothetical protein